MNNLFWRFFLVFWATLVFAVLLAWGIYKVQLTRLTNDNTTFPSSQFMLDISRTLVKNQSFNELEQFLEKHGHAPWNDTTVWLINLQKQDFFGRKVSDINIDELADKTPDYTDKQGMHWYLVLSGKSAMPPAPPFRGLANPPGPPFKASPDLNMITPPDGRPPRPPLPFWLHPAFLLTAILLASIVFSMLLARYIASPVRQLKQALAKLADNHWQTQLSPQLTGRQDEFGALSRNFNQMASSVANAIESQRRLLHDVSHELRSPLARLQILTGLSNQSPEEAVLLLQKVEKETEKLEQLVDEILTFSRLESGNTSLQLTDVDLTELLYSICEDAQLEAQSHCKQLRTELSDVSLIQGDSALLYRACENVIRNAVKFAAENTVISVKLTQPEKHILLTVSNMGDGVKEEDLPDLFTPFFRANRSCSSDGVGLGLSIAKRAVEAHHGSIQAANLKSGNDVIGFQVKITFPINHTE